MEHQPVVDDTRRWIASIVIGLNLCPFARKAFREETIRYVVTEAREGTDLLAALAEELKALAAAPRESVETTLLIHPAAMRDFLDYNDFLGEADDLVERLGFTGVIQIASFHPDYQFAGVPADAVQNYTNRSPYPMLHLLREVSVEEVAEDPQTLADIPRRNIKALNTLGREKLLKLLEEKTDAP
ncbi:MAG: DUF1415 domain-containing protein [Planctomycetota bacterium]|nr:DUF1415 domain-containing protein [Planctomycetota bacterium]